MKIELTLNSTQYAIDIDSNQFTALRYSTITAEGANFGKQREVQLGFFSNLSSAAKRLVREEISESQDVVSLQEFLSRYEALVKELTSQVEVNL